MPKHPYWQGGMDSMCGIYSIINADKIVNKSSEEDSQYLFNGIIEYLSKKRKLKDIIIGGVYHKDMISILANAIGNRFRWRVIGNNFNNVSEFWKYSNDFLKENNGSSLIVSFGGKEDHLSAVMSMTAKTMTLFDSSGIIKVRKSMSKLMGYSKDDKYVIYPTQSFLCWKN